MMTAKAVKKVGLLCLILKIRMRCPQQFQDVYDLKRTKISDKVTSTLPLGHFPCIAKPFQQKRDALNGSLFTNPIRQAAWTREAAFEGWFNKLAIESIKQLNTR